MKEVTVNREELLKILRKNRADHRKIFEDALEGFRKDALAQLEQRIADLRNGFRRTVVVHIASPADHTKDYDRAIRMVDMSVTETLVLSEQDFQNYIMDDWSWQRQFVQSASVYNSDLGKDFTRTKFGDRYETDQ